MMNSPHIWIGAGIGGLIGGVGGGFVAKKFYKPKTTKSSDDAVVVQKPKHLIFDVPTRTLSKGSELFLPLSRFHQALRHKEEFLAFENAVKHFDNLCGMEFSLHGKGANPKNAYMVSFAQRALNSALEQLNAIIEFGDQIIPSKSRKTELEGFVDTMKKISENIIQSMTNLLAGYSDIE